MDYNGMAAGMQSSCFSVSGGSSYSFGGQSKAIQPSNMGYEMTCLFFPDKQCTGDNFDDSEGPLTFWSQLNAWLAATPVNGVLPADTQSALCRIGVINAVPASVVSGEGTGLPQIDVRFDNLFFQSAQPNEIFGDGFDL
jgi:hypothetical protein